ncbi:MAG: type III pantothenate kinase [Lachnospiraceae bacterium]|nr:type III pantothenate kinase [Lachnospiraceae bacterium]
MMLFTIDIGNTNVVVGAVDEKHVLFRERILTDATQTVQWYADQMLKKLADHGLRPYAFENAVIGSVVPAVTELTSKAWERIRHQKPFIIDKDIKTDLNLQIDNPAAMGRDILIGAVAAAGMYPLPQIIFDVGTATTVCVIDKDRNIPGYMIIPGPYTSLNALTAKAAQLPEITFDEPPRMLGKNTVECMRSGIMYGHACMMEEIIHRIETEILHEKATVVATGGPVVDVIPLIHHEIFLERDLLLVGMVQLYLQEKNLDTAKNAN